MKVGDLVRLTMGQDPPPEPPRIGILVSDNVEEFTGMEYCCVLFEGGCIANTIAKNWLARIND
jgi:hypothetical protein